MQKASKLLLFLGLTACGAPGSDAVFSRKDSAPAAKAVTPAPAPAHGPETKQYRGFYRRVGEDSRFMPCGTRELLEVYGDFTSKAMLKDRYRWIAPWEGTKTFGVLRGAIVTDTPRVAGDTVTPRPRTRFLIVDLDTLRIWRSTDCNGMKVPAIDEPR